MYVVVRWLPDGEIMFLNHSIDWSSNIEDAMKMSFHRASAMVAMYGTSDEFSVVRIDDIKNLKGS